jgi:hypothetical protein
MGYCGSKDIPTFKETDVLFESPQVESTKVIHIMLPLLKKLQIIQDN